MSRKKLVMVVVLGASFSVVSLFVIGCQQYFQFGRYCEDIQDDELRRWAIENSARVEQVNRLTQLCRGGTYVNPVQIDRCAEGWLKGDVVEVAMQACHKLKSHPWPLSWWMKSVANG